MDDKTKRAYDWALNQQHNSVAATYARDLAEYIRDNMVDMSANEAEYNERYEIDVISEVEARIKPEVSERFAGARFLRIAHVHLRPRGDADGEKEYRCIDVSLKNADRDVVFWASRTIDD